MASISGITSGATYFSATLPDVTVTSSGTRCRFTITLAGTAIYNELLRPSSGRIHFYNFADLIQPWAHESVSGTLSMTAIDVSASGNESGSTSVSATVIYSAADVDGQSAGTFTSSRFLTLLDGPKLTAMRRLEYLHFIGSGTISMTGSVYNPLTGIIAPATATPVLVADNSGIKTYDVSPSRFNIPAGRSLCDYTVSCGSRSQKYLIDHTLPDSAPVLVFENSFGCDELIYCTGEHKVNPKYDRQSTRIRGLLQNYRIDETRAFEANTGFLPRSMANWADDLFRSDNVRIVNFYNGAPAVGKDVVITDSKSEVSNLDNYAPAFTFTYQYAQRNHNVIQTQRPGRIFDNTFDFTFN